MKKSQTIRIIILVLLAGATLWGARDAWSAYWILMSKQIVTNNFGTQVLQCTWKDSQSGRITITQGYWASFCPRPF
jgi:hypothetical protein